ncbi:MAG: bifunctional diaminohydroxyphosphoribosylaminopyrimidine deaminase/5-amino-6-(5-phosphoribosylamino)uracil reductase RibD [Steroidobacterales bacterium]
MTFASAVQDQVHMSRALQLAARGLYTTDPNPRVGCVLVKDGSVVGEGWHVRAGEAHAEVLALRAAGVAARGASAYVTLEPCSHTGRTPPCADALIDAGVARVFCASADPNPIVGGTGIARLRAAGIEVSVGALAGAARELNVGFFSRFERSRPFVRLKLAMSLDGRTAPAGGGHAWISGEAARADVQHWRARSSAVLTGAGTVCSDDPRLDVRIDYGGWVRQPLRVVLDPGLRCARAAKIFQAHGALVFAAPDSAVRDGGVRDGDGVRVQRVGRDGSGVDLHAVMAALQAQSVNELLVECGPRLAASFLRAGLVDELILYVAAHMLGADAQPLTALRALGEGGIAPAFDFHDVRRVGADLRLLLKPRSGQ